jgi:hypothetical protein
MQGCLNGELRLWNVRKRTCLRHAVLGPDRVTSVAFRPHDRSAPPPAPFPCFRPPALHPAPCATGAHCGASGAYWLPACLPRGARRPSAVGRVPASGALALSRLGGCRCSMVAAACGRDLYFWDVSSEDDTKEPHKEPQKVLETTIGFLCLYFHPNGKWLITCEGLLPLPSPPSSAARPARPPSAARPARPPGTPPSLPSADPRLRTPAMCLQMSPEEAGCDVGEHTRGGTVRSLNNSASSSGAAPANHTPHFCIRCAAPAARRRAARAPRAAALPCLQPYAKSVPACLPHAARRRPGSASARRTRRREQLPAAAPRGRGLGALGHSWRGAAGPRG